MTNRPVRFKTRIALAGLFLLGMMAALSDASAAEPIRRKSFAPKSPSISKQAPTRPPGIGPSLGNPSRLSPGAIGQISPPSGITPGAVGLDRTRLTDVGRPQPSFPGLERLPQPGAGLQRPDLTPPVGVVKDRDRTAPPSALPTPTDEERNRQAGICLAGIVSHCNGNVPPGGQPGNGNTDAQPPAKTDPPSARTGGGSGGGGGISASFDFGAGGGASPVSEAAAPACVADPTDVYKLLECAKSDFAAGIIDRRQYESRKADALALLDPGQLGADLILRVLRDLVDAGLITANDREMQKRALIAKL